MMTYTYYLIQNKDIEMLSLFLTFGIKFNRITLKQVYTLKWWWKILNISVLNFVLKHKTK